jgi:hypothetical protein
MAASLCVLTCALLAGQPAGGFDWLAVPRLRLGQELVYTGAVTEEFTGASVQCSRSYRLDSRVFVLETPEHGTDVALLTGLILRNPRPADDPAAARPEAASVRLELAHVDPRGRLSGPPGSSLAVPLQGPATAECGAFVEVPQARLSAAQRWTTAEDGRPPHAWRVAGTEAVGGTMCLKLVGVQQSADWDYPRSDSTAWRRRDTVWMTPALGAACKVERVIERREPARLQPTERSVATYELQSAFVYPDRLCQERVLEIRQARNLVAVAEPLLRQPGRYGARDFEIFLQRVAYQLEHQPESPYHNVLRQLQARLEAAQHGDTPVAVPDEAPAPPATPGRQAAPDFVVPALSGSEPFRFSRLRGRAALLIFFSPASPTLDAVLRLGQSVQDAFGDSVAVVGLAVGDDKGAVVRQQAQGKLTYVLASGKSVCQAFGVESTPQFVVLDAGGKVRGSYTGWGPEIGAEVRQELRRWLTTPTGERR